MAVRIEVRFTPNNRHSQLLIILLSNMAVSPMKAPVILQLGQPVGMFTAQHLQDRIFVLTPAEGKNKRLSDISSKCARYQRRPLRHADHVDAVVAALVADARVYAALANCSWMVFSKASSFCTLSRVCMRSK